MFVPNALSTVFRIWIAGYKSYVRSQSDFCIISFCQLRCNLCDNARVLNTEARFCRQEPPIEHRGDVSSTRVAFEPLCGVSSTGVAFWPLCTISSTGVAFELLRCFSLTGKALLARCSVSSTGVAFWGHWFFACFLYILSSFCIFHLHNAYERCVLHVNSWGIYNFIIKE